MGFISAFANLGSIGSTTKWAIKMYNERSICSKISKRDLPTKNTKTKF